jgi:WD40 repeat protein
MRSGRLTCRHNSKNLAMRPRRRDGRSHVSVCLSRLDLYATDLLSAPENATLVETLPSDSNILSATIEQVAVEGSLKPLMFATTADRRVNVLDTPSCALRSSTTGLQDSPVLSSLVLREKYVILTSMSGQLVIADLAGNVLEKRRDHVKYVVNVKVIDNTDKPLLATAAWDNKINIYSLSTSNPPTLGDPIATISLPSKPESILFLQHPESQEPIILVSRTDSTHIYYYTTESEPRLLGRQNLAPHSNAWVGFTPSALAICPNDSSLLACATSAVPSMKLLIARMLIPPWEETVTVPPTVLRTSLLDDNPDATETQASQARVALLLADKEEAAIQIHCTTLSPQSAYSTPAVAWRPDGSGVWVNGDDGVVRGIEAASGKIVATLKGHEPGSKVRCLWAGMVGEEEWLVSGGFDQKLLVWKV